MVEKQKVNRVVILMSTYNGEKYIDRQLEGIYKQQGDFELSLYVRDDGSTDKTVDRLCAWRDKLQMKLLLERDNLGTARSFWKLFTTAPDAEYYAFADQDDEWDNCKLDKAVKALEVEKDRALWFCNCRIINKFNEVISEVMNDNKPILTIPSQLVCGSVQGCAMVFNRQAKDYIINKNICIIPMHDTVLMLYMLAAGRVIYEPMPLFSYRLHENNVIAKGGKKWIKKIEGSCKLWFSKESRNVLSSFALQILRDNNEYLDEDIKKYLYILGNSRKNFVNRIKIVRCSDSYSNNRRGERSFKIRVLLGLI